MLGAAEGAVSKLSAWLGRLGRTIPKSDRSCEVGTETRVAPKVVAGPITERLAARHNLPRFRGDVPYF
jgi:hypothetical protein